MKKILLLLLILITSCTNVKTQSDPNPNIVVPDDINYCKAGCEKLMSLIGPDGKDGCLEARTLQYPDGGRQNCEEFCTITEKNGRSLDPKCWTTLLSCNEIENCRKN